MLNGKNLFHSQEAEIILQNLESSKEGLSTEEAARRLEKYGKNELEEGKERTLLHMLLDQFKGVVVIILIAASIISALLGEIADTAIIMVVVVVNAIIGVIQENKAEKAMEALKKMAAPYAKVRRNGEVTLCKTEQIVPGDIVILETGDFVPADMRLIEIANLKIEEAALTGESVPSEKEIRVIEQEDVPLGDKKNLAFLGSSVTYGRGTGVVIGTGMKTEVGKIAGYLTEGGSDPTPLQKKLDQMGKYLSIAVLAISIFIFTVGILRGRDIFEMFLTAVSIAVAAIPEGLPAVVTIVLALGVQRMAKRHAIIRKLPAVETLGSTQIICSDKTGTLTQNKMTVQEIFFFSIPEKDEKLGSTVKVIDIPLIGMKKNARLLMDIGVLCNDSKISEKEKGKIIGDPTEVALVNLAINKDIHKYQLEETLPRVAEIPFDSDRKLMTTVHEISDNHKKVYRALTKGAIDSLLVRCSHILLDGKAVTLDDAKLDEIHHANTAMADQAIRVLAFAYKELDALPDDMICENIEKDLIFVGLVGMIDPPREEAKEAIRVCKAAGIRPIMITGDHRLTASAIARELGITNDDSEVITGNELDKISTEDFKKNVQKYSVYARVSPEHKVKIVKAWRAFGKIVAMTGDGVNDAPALKSADIGIGMGITGTDVAKGVSDIVLTDDNFATIVIAVEEGRTIYKNIRRAILFLLSCNLAEVAALFIATLFNWTILLPIHILWVNLVTDSFPALALGMEKAHSNIMNVPPVDTRGNILTGGMGIKILYQGLIQGLITLAAFYIGTIYWPTDPGSANTVAITMAFATLGLVQLAHSLNVRSDRSLFKLRLPTNPYLLGAILLSASLQTMVIFIPFLNKVFRVQALNLQQWGIVLLLSLSIIPIVEMIKLFEKLKQQ